jgi:hypothetical protein
MWRDRAPVPSAEKGGDPELVRESQRRRYADISLVDKVVELDGQWRDGALSLNIMCASLDQTGCGTNRAAAPSKSPRYR